MYDLYDFQKNFYRTKKLLETEQYIVNPKAYMHKFLLKEQHSFTVTGFASIISYCASILKQNVNVLDYTGFCYNLVGSYLSDRCALYCSVSNNPVYFQELKRINNNLKTFNDNKAYLININKKLMLPEKLFNICVYTKNVDLDIMANRSLVLLTGKDDIDRLEYAGYHWLETIKHRSFIYLFGK